MHMRWTLTKLIIRINDLNQPYLMEPIWRQFVYWLKILIILSYGIFVNNEITHTTKDKSLGRHCVTQN